MALTDKAFLQTRKLLRYIFIRAGLELIALSKAGRLFPSLGGRGIIFTLHHVRPANTTDDFLPNAILTVTPEFLEQAIITALEAGLTPVHLHDLPVLLANPDDNRKFVAFTLDDGYRNNLEYAAPLFARYNIPYTIFITPGFVDGYKTIWWETAEALIRNNSILSFDFGDGRQEMPTTTTKQKHAAFTKIAYYVQNNDEDEAVRQIDTAAINSDIDPLGIVADLVMTRQELQQLASDPLLNYGAHTLSHINLRNVDADRQFQEIDQSVQWLQQLGFQPRSFAYPYGWKSAVSESASQAVKKAGLSLAVTTQPGILNDASLDRLTTLPRVSLNGYYQKKRYVQALISGLPFYCM